MVKRYKQGGNGQNLLWGGAGVKSRPKEDNRRMYRFSAPVPCALEREPKFLSKNGWANPARPKPFT